MIVAERVCLEGGPISGRLIDGSRRTVQECLRGSAAGHQTTDTLAICRQIVVEVGVRTPGDSKVQHVIDICRDFIQSPVCEVGLDARDTKRINALAIFGLAESSKTIDLVSRSEFPRDGQRDLTRHTRDQDSCILEHQHVFSPPKNLPANRDRLHELHDPPASDAHAETR